MYQMLIEDKHNGDIYLSSIVVSESELAQRDLREFAQREHLQRRPDDKLLTEENLNKIFAQIDIIGLVPLKFKPVNI